MAELEQDFALEVDLHARPAGALVKAALGFNSQVRVAFSGRSANARSLISVLGLGATRGNTIQLYAEGDDASDALKALVSCLAAFQ